MYSRYIFKERNLKYVQRDADTLPQQLFSTFIRF